MNEIKGEEFTKFISMIDRTEVRFFNRDVIDYIDVTIEKNSDLTNRIIFKIKNYRDILDIVSSPMDKETFKSIVHSVKVNGLIKEYPILLDNKNLIVDGRHRIKAHAISKLESILGIDVDSFTDEEASLKDITNVLSGTNFPYKKIEEDISDLMIEHWIRNISENNKRPTNAIKAIIAYNTYKLHKNKGEKVKLKDFAFGCDEREIGIIRYLNEEFNGKYKWVISELMRYKTVKILSKPSKTLRKIKSDIRKKEGKLSNLILIYIIQAVGLPECYKIGYTTKLTERLNHYNYMVPYGVNLINTIEVNSVEDAKIVESSLHKKYKNYKVSGEWFKLTEEHLEEIKETYNNGNK